MQTLSRAELLDHYKVRLALVLSRSGEPVRVYCHKKHLLVFVCPTGCYLDKRR